MAGVRGKGRDEEGREKVERQDGSGGGRGTREAGLAGNENGGSRG